MEIQNIPIKTILGDSNFNCRGVILPFDVETLKDSIKEKGLQQPIVVQPYSGALYQYRTVMGHRRLKACEILGWETIPCIVRTDLTDTQARAMNLIENLERQDLTVMQEARAIENIVKNGYNRTEIGKLINKSDGWVQIRTMALRMPPDIQDKIHDGTINQTQIRQLYSIPTLNGKYEFVRGLIDAKLRGDKWEWKDKPTKLDTPYLKKVRGLKEIFEQQDKIRDTLGNNLATRALAWAAGEITTEELDNDIESERTENG